NVPTSFLLQGDEECVLAVSKSEPNDPSGLALRTDTGAEILAGSFNISGPLPNEWKGRRVLMTNAGPIQLTLSMMEIAPRPKTVWSKSYPMPAWTTAVDDEEFAVLDSKGMVHVHSFETGNRIIETEIERPGSPP